MNNLQLVWAAKGYHLQKRTFYELRQWPFTLAELQQELESEVPKQLTPAIDDKEDDAATQETPGAP